VTDAPPQSPVEHPFASFVRILGKGRTGTRSLTREEAHQAMGMILRDETEPVQLGAFLMLLRVKEESPGEMAGLVGACRDNMRQPPEALQADLDWSSYAGKKHQHPWFILSMLLLSQAGYRVFVHGSAGHTPGRLYTEAAMRRLELPVATDWSQVAGALDAHRLCYLALDHFCPRLQDLMQLKPLLGLRSPINTLARMINPLRAPASVQSIFHPAYAALHREADRIVEQPASLVFKGESGEVEVKPHAGTRLYLRNTGGQRELSLPRAFARRPAAVAQCEVQPLRSLWRGNEHDAYGAAATLGTTAAVLLLLDPGLGVQAATEQALALWHERDRYRLG